MSSFHFPIILGNNRQERVVIVHLVDEQEEYSENRVVIALPGTANDPLFKIPKARCIVDDCGKTIKDKGFPGKVTVDGKDIIVTADRPGYFRYFVKKDKFDGVVTFNYSITGENGNEMNYVGFLHIVRPRENEVKVITADLGSDSTQVTYSSGYERPNWVRLIEQFKKAYSPQREYGRKPQGLADPVFIQEEKGNPMYYKTGGITFKDEGRIDAGIQDDDTFINYLTVSAAGKNVSYGSSYWSKEDEFHHKLVNIKLLYSIFGGTEDLDLVDNITQFGYKRTGSADRIEINDDEPLLEVLKAIYRQVILVSKDAACNKTTKYVSVLLLVPNIYNQSGIDKLLYELNLLMNPKYVVNKEGEEKTDVLYDFRIVSESDSAFIGLNEVSTNAGDAKLLPAFLASENVDGDKMSKKRDYFLLVDAGKGTTDFSVIRYGFNTRGRGTANNLITPVRRNGIVGAGGAIDYVFARVLARQIYRHKDEFGTISPIVDESVFIDRFMTMIQFLQPVDQDKLMLIIETLKKSYDDGKVALLYLCFKGAATIIVQKLLNAGTDDKQIKELGKSDTMVDSFKTISMASVDLDDYESEELADVDKKEVNWVCKAIANTIIVDMIFKGLPLSLIKKIDYVFFTGRAFLFQPLKQAFEDALEQKRGFYKENYEFPVFLTSFKRDKEENDPNKKNLKPKCPDGLQTKMKQISVQYSGHDFGLNCNSNLCCIQGLADPNDEEDVVKLERFWKGFKGVGLNKNNTYYYIGYKEQSFSSTDGRANPDNRIQFSNDFTKSLIKMTLFPVRYIPVKFDEKLLAKYVSSKKKKAVAGLPAVDGND